MHKTTTRELYTTSPTTISIKMPTLIPRFKKTHHHHKKLHESDEEPILEFQKIDNEIIEINIVVEVNSITHLLELIEKYEINSKFHYNINMEALHKDQRTSC